jgi:pimeloyl-ACP methyl ester carboxylesterase
MGNPHDPATPPAGERRWGQPDLGRCQRPIRRLALLLLLALHASCDSSRPMLEIVAYKKDVVADDGFALTVRDLHLKGHAQNEVPRAWLFYLVGSQPVSTTSAAGEYAEGIAQGFVVVLLQPRGVSSDGTVDQEVFQRYETRQRRVADQLAVMDAYLGDSRNIPVLLAGSSLGGVVAADVAARDLRGTHLLMMASGGGWTQAEEGIFFLEHGQPPPGIATLEELNAKYAEIQAAPDSGEMWYGHPFRMWSSYLWFRPMDGLTTRPIPMFLAQGTADTATPVESARAMRDEFARLGLTHLTYAEYPGLDHHFSNQAGESRLMDLRKDVYAWMSKTGLPNPAP